jgi:hypothetical protein
MADPTPDALETTRPELCESCAAGRHRAYCATFPRPCEDLIEIWDSAREEALEEAANIAYLNDCDEAARLICALKDGAK